MLWMIVTTGLLLALAVAVLLRRLAAPRVCCEGEWMDRVSGARYRPMERLLDPAEEAWLRRRAADRSAMRRFRAERRRLFRAYLRGLESDFRKLSAAVKLLLVEAGEDRPELAVALLKRQATFTLGLAGVRFRLALHAAGLGTVDVRELVTALDALRAEAGRLVPAPAAAPAS